MILYSAADLVWATRIKGIADALAIPCRPVRNPEMLRARLADSCPSNVQALIVDLDAADVALELIEMLRRPDGLDPDKMVTIVAFGPHVATDVFEKVRNAGADVVLARGAFDRRLPEILRDLHAGRSRESGAGS